MLSCCWHATPSHHGKEIHVHMSGKITRELLAKHVAFNHSSLSVTLYLSIIYNIFWNINHHKVLIKIPPKSISEYLIFEIFLGGMPPDLPSNSKLVVLRTTLINLLKQPLHILVVWPDHLKIASYAPGTYVHWYVCTYVRRYVDTYVRSYQYCYLVNQLTIAWYLSINLEHICR